MTSCAKKTCLFLRDFEQVGMLKTSLSLSLRVIYFLDKNVGFLVGFLLENCHVTIPCQCQAWNSDISRVPSVCSPWYLRRNWDRGIAVVAWRLGLAGRLNRFVRAMGYTRWHWPLEQDFFAVHDRNPFPKFPVGEWVPILVGRWRRKWSCFLGCNTLR